MCDTRALEVRVGSTGMLVVFFLGAQILFSLLITLRASSWRGCQFF